MKSILKYALIALLGAGSMLVLNAQTVTVPLVATYGSVCASNYNGVCVESFAAAIADAKTYLAANPNATYTINVPANYNGQPYDFSDEAGTPVPYSSASNVWGCTLSKTPAAIVLDGISPTGTGRLVINGAGMNNTTLITNNDRIAVSGAGTSHITIENMTFARYNPSTANPSNPPDTLNVSQGKITAASSGTSPATVTIVTDSGFPDPKGIDNTPPPGFGPCGTVAPQAGRMLMAYGTDANGDYTIPLGGDTSPDLGRYPYLNWASVSSVQDPVTKLYTATFTLAEPDDDTTSYWLTHTDDLVIAIKSKKSSQAYSFDNRPIDPTTGDVCQAISSNCPTLTIPASDIILHDIVWMDMARGQFRGGFTNSKVTNSSTLRRTVNGVVAALSSSSGGPQFGGEPCDLLPKALRTATGALQFYTTSGNLVEYYTAEGTGDDSLAIFDDVGTTANGNRSSVRNSSMIDSMETDLKLNNSDNVLQTSVTAPYTDQKSCTATEDTPSATSVTLGDTLQLSVVVRPAQGSITGGYVLFSDLMGNPVHCDEGTTANKAKVLIDLSNNVDATDAYPLTCTMSAPNAPAVGPHVYSANYLPGGTAQYQSTSVPVAVSVTEP